MAPTGDAGPQLASLTIEEAIELLQSGAVVAVPTDTVYGVAVDAARLDATDLLFAVKQRPESVALPVLCEGAAQALSLVHPEKRAEVRLLGGAFWPGPLTIVVPRRTDLRWRLGGDPATIGVRVPDDDDLRAICRVVGPLAVSSANRHGSSPCTTADEVRRELGAEVRVLDGGKRSAPVSTVVDCTADRPLYRRDGAVPREHIDEILSSIGDT
jgi:tRNA threonylcarbamoyl adenosine modification protein (Sua5/YciO/YrdC/YwlC family)